MGDIDGGGVFIHFLENLENIFDQSKIDKKAMKVFTQFLKDNKDEIKIHKDNGNFEKEINLRIKRGEVYDANNI